MGLATFESRDIVHHCPHLCVQDWLLPSSHKLALPVLVLGDLPLQPKGGDLGKEQVREFDEMIRKYSKRLLENPPCRKVQLSRRMGGIGSEQLLFGQHVASFRKYIFGQTHLSLYLGTCESDLRVLAIAFFGCAKGSRISTSVVKRQKLMMRCSDIDISPILSIYLTILITMFHSFLSGTW